MKKLILGPFWPKNLISRLFLKSHLYQFQAFIILCKKSENFCVSIFHKTWKTSFWVHYGSILAPFCLKNSKQDFSQKKQSTLRLYVAVTLLKS